MKIYIHSQVSRADRNKDDKDRHIPATFVIFVPVSTSCTSPAADDLRPTVPLDLLAECLPS